MDFWFLERCWPWQKIVSCNQVSLIEVKQIAPGKSWRPPPGGRNTSHSTSSEVRQVGSVGLCKNPHEEDAVSENSWVVEKFKMYHQYVPFFVCHIDRLCYMCVTLVYPVQMKWCLNFAKILYVPSYQPFWMRYLRCRKRVWQESMKASWCFWKWVIQCPFSWRVKKMFTEGVWNCMETGSCIDFLRSKFLKAVQSPPAGHDLHTLFPPSKTPFSGVFCQSRLEEQECHSKIMVNAVWKLPCTVFVCICYK